MHVFEITKEVWSGLTVEEIATTVADMKELGIYHRPFNDTIVIKTPFAMPPSWKREGAHPVWSIAWCEVIFAPGGEGITTIVTRPKDSDPQLILKAMSNVGMSGAYDRDRGVIIINALDIDPAETAFAMDALITLLATKGVEKRTRQNKLAKLGIGRTREAAESTTIISLSRLLPFEGESHTFSQKRPHLRRGHIRQQHYGKENLLTKPVWIEPTFINGDPSFFNTRHQYKIVQ